MQNLNDEQRKLVETGVQYFLPWRYVQNENSLSTPVRPVFDGSSATQSGFSLNDLVAKGINSLNNLLEVFIRFRSYSVALHTDIKQMYNVVKLYPEHWKFQLYLFHPTLSDDESPQAKFVKTLIYGVKSGRMCPAWYCIGTRKYTPSSSSIHHL